MAVQLSLPVSLGTTINSRKPDVMRPLQASLHTWLSTLEQRSLNTPS
jgi:hypothetical protein